MQMLYMQLLRGRFKTKQKEISPQTCNDLFARRHLFKSVQTYHRKYLLSTGGCRVCTDSQNICATGYKLATKPVLNTKQKTRDP